MKIKHIWEIPYYLDQFDEDNDTDDEDESDEEEENKKPKIK